MQPETDETIAIESPVAGDVDDLVGLFKEDMDDLGVDVSRRDLRDVAEAAVEGADGSPRRCLCWVARRKSEGDVVGVVLANFNLSLKFAGRSLWIEALYVTPDHRRRGIGRRLVEHLLDWAEDHEVRGIDLEAYRGNTSASILYRSLGFHRLGRERFYYRVGGSGYL